MRKNINLIFTVLALSVLTLSYQNCGGAFNSSTQQNSTSNNNNSSTPDQWVVTPAPQFVEGSGESFNLYTTLPSGVKPNGTFGVDTSSGPGLPAGMSLNPNTGIISVGTAVASTTMGVVFTYTEPTM